MLCAALQETVLGSELLKAGLHAVVQVVGGVVMANPLGLIHVSNGGRVLGG
jgi:hypothetical protein